MVRFENLTGIYEKLQDPLMEIILETYNEINEGENAFQYIPKREKAHPEYANELMEGKYLPVELIDNKGNCNEQFVLTSTALAERISDTRELFDSGMKITGLSVVPDPSMNTDQPGHIVTVYQDPRTQKYGTTGARGDITPPIFDSLGDIALHMALDNGWQCAIVHEVIPSEGLIEAEEPIELYKRRLPDSNLKAAFGIEHIESDSNRPQEKVKAKLMSNGYMINAQPYIFSSKLPGELQNQLITGVYAGLYPKRSRENRSLQVGADFNHKEYSASVVVYFDESGEGTYVPSSIQVHKSHKNRMLEEGDLRTYTKKGDGRFTTGIAGAEVEEQLAPLYIDAANQIRLFLNQLKVHQYWAENIAQETTPQNSVLSLQDQVQVFFLPYHIEICTNVAQGLEESGHTNIDNITQENMEDLYKANLLF